MAELIDALRVTTAGVFVLLGVASFIHWKRRGGEAAGWLAASFGVLGAVVLESLILPEDPQGALVWVQKVAVAVILLFPYCLYRFTASFSRSARWVDLAANVLTAGLVVWALVMPSLPGPGEPRSAVVQAFILGLLTQWAGLSVISAVRLWRAGRDQPTPGRRRMRLLSMGAVGLSAGIVLAGFGGSGPSLTMRFVVQLLALTSAVTFFLGFSPPRVLRLAWRRPEEDEFQRAMGELMTALRVEEVAARLLPHVTDIVAGRGAALLDETGRVIGLHGRTPEDVETLSPPKDGGDRWSDEPGPDVVRLSMHSGSLLVWASPYAPFFAREELDLLAALANLADLALERVKLGERAARLAQVVHSSHDAITSNSLDGTITSWNRGAEDVYGYSEEETLGRSISMLVPSDRADEVPEILERIGRGQPIDHYETLRRCKDGRVIAVSLSISPVKDADGKITGAATIARDVTQRKQNEQTIRDQASLLDLAQDAILARDLDGRIKYWNSGAVGAYGFSKGEALGRVSHDLLRTGFPGPLEEIQTELLRNRRWEGELVQTRRDGSEMIVSSRWTLQTDDRGDPVQVLEVNTDITAQKAAARALHSAKEEAERANMAKSEFLSRMSHELRTPLNAILGFGQLLEMENLTHEQRQSVAEIIKGGRHLLDLINEVLDIARIEVGELAISLEPVPVADVIGEALNLIGPLADQRELILTPPGADCQELHVLADKQRLKQVLLNLLSNAVKYNVSGGTVHLFCHGAPGETVRISVSDTGPGIPKEKLDQLFVPFERLGVESTVEEGTGLGLALVKRLVEAMGGDVGVETEPGSGSTFWIDLPWAESPVFGAEVPDDEDPDDDGGSQRPSRTVLYVEDNLSNLKLIQRILARRPEITLITAMQGRLSLELAREHHPDLILLDLQLPDISGKDVLKALKQGEATRDIPVVVVSADATKGQVTRLLESGARAYLTKPLNIREFLRVLEEELGRIPQQDRASSNVGAD